MTRKGRKGIISLLIVLAALLGAVLWAIWGNTALEQNTYTIQSDRLPEAFSGYRIAHVSDLHNAEMGKNNAELLGMLQEANPDLIALTGDLIDSRNTDIDSALQFAKAAMQIAPCYYVTGNHEARISGYADLKKGLTEAGVVVLENERMEIEREGGSIALIGVDDPSFQTDYLFGDAETVLRHHLKQLAGKEDEFAVLLSHRPELFEIYAESHMDLVLSGHAHGGQFRLPFVGGLVAPNQGFFPEYDAGLYTKNGTNMLVSRGIGNSIIPLRLNNRPEVIVIELEAE